MNVSAPPTSPTPQPHLPHPAPAAFRSQWQPGWRCVGPEAGGDTVCESSVRLVRRQMHVARGQLYKLGPP